MKLFLLAKHNIDLGSTQFGSDISPLVNMHIHKTMSTQKESMHSKTAQTKRRAQKKPTSKRKNLERIAHPQHAQLIAHIGGRKRYGRRAGDIRTLQFCDQIVNGQRMDLFVLRECGDGVPAKVSDECDASGIVRRFRCDGAIKVRKLDAVAERRRCGTE